MTNATEQANKETPVPSAQLAINGGVAQGGIGNDKGKSGAAEKAAKAVDGATPPPPPAAVLAPTAVAPRVPLNPASLPKSTALSTTKPPDSLPPRSPATQSVALSSTSAKPVAKPVATKKRKLSAASNSAAAQSRASPSTTIGGTPLTDPAVIKAVHNILGLLQTYGPLSLGQLEHNLPPLSSSSLSDVVQLLVATGVVQVVDGPPPIRYTTLSGKVRADVILPHEVVDEILATQEQVKQSLDRTELIRQALLEEEEQPPKQLLEKLLSKYPDIVKDPVYMTAFRNFNVNVAAAGMDHRGQATTVQGKKRATTSSGVESISTNAGGGGTSKAT